MAKKEYSWELGSKPPIIHTHSLAKHEILRAYLTRYLEVVVCNPKMDRLRLTLVDGFAGGGLYQHELTKQTVPGSPLIFLEATLEAEHNINKNRKKQFLLNADYFFVEKEQSSLDFLKYTLEERGFKSQLSSKIQLVNGEFAEKSDSIINSIRQKSRKGRSIFLLDQYGYKDVPFPLIFKIFSSLQKAEVILTFAVDSLIDYLSTSDTSRQILKRLGLLETLSDGLINSTKGAGDRRTIIQSLLSPEIHKASGAKYYTPFFISSRESNKDYWLVHLSMHAQARDEMTKLHWALQNHFRHNGGAGLNMLGYDPHKDRSITNQARFEDFNFDNQARELSIKALRRDLPALMLGHPSGIDFQTLLDRTCNTTPASSDIYREAMSEFIETKELIIQSPSGVQRRKGESIDTKDIIQLPPQRTFFFGKK